MHVGVRCTSNIKPLTVSVCLSVCLPCARTFLALLASNSLWLLGAPGQLLVGLTLPILQFAKRYPSIPAFSYVDDCHFIMTSTSKTIHTLAKH